MPSRSNLFSFPIWMVLLLLLCEGLPITNHKDGHVQFFWLVPSVWICSLRSKDLFLLCFFSGLTLNNLCSDVLKLVSFKVNQLLPPNCYQCRDTINMREENRNIWKFLFLFFIFLTLLMHTSLITDLYSCMFLAGTLSTVVISRYFVLVRGFKQYHLGAASNIELQREKWEVICVQSGFHRPTTKKTTFRIQALGEDSEETEFSTSAAQSLYWSG